MANASGDTPVEVTAAGDTSVEETDEMVKEVFVEVKWANNTFLYDTLVSTLIGDMRQALRAAMPERDLTGATFMRTSTFKAPDGDANWTTMNERESFAEAGFTNLTNPFSPAFVAILFKDEEEPMYEDFSTPAPLLSCMKAGELQQ